MDETNKPTLKRPVSVGLSEVEREMLGFLKTHHNLSQSRIVGMLIQAEHRRITESRQGVFMPMPLLMNPTSV